MKVFWPQNAEGGSPADPEFAADPRPGQSRIPMAEGTERPTGVLLVNLGTPDSTSVRDVRRYLREFLSDPDVVDIPAFRRWLLLNLVVLPFRPARSAKAYRSIWTEAGSPLLLHHLKLTDQVRAELGEGFRVEPAMRYGSPSIRKAMDRLLGSGVKEVVVVPLFPQYSASAFGSALKSAVQIAGIRSRRLPVLSVEPFFEHPAFIDTWARVARPHLEAFDPDHLLITYHGVPERQIHKSDPTGMWCLRRPDCCDVPSPVHRYCYRAQCFRTTKALLPALGWDPDRASTSFQSRLGRAPWLRPYTDDRIRELAEQGVRRLAVMSPSFVADCLETLEEIGKEGREAFRRAGGEELLLIPSLNSDRRWSDTVVRLVRERLAG